MNKKIWTYVIAILCILGGVYLIIKPEQSFSNVVYYVGLAILIAGILKIISSLFNKESILMPGNYFFTGVINTLFGIILMSNSHATIKIIPIFVGIWLILSGTSGLAAIINLGRNNNKFNNQDLIINIVKLILGIIVLTTPIISIIFTGWIIGIILVGTGVYLIFNSLKDRKIYKVKVK